MDIPENLMALIDEEEKKEMSMEDFFKGLKYVDIKPKKGSWKNDRLEFDFDFGAGPVIVSVTRGHMTPDIFNAVFFLKTKRFIPVRFYGDSLTFWEFFVAWSSYVAGREMHYF